MDPIIEHRLLWPMFHSWFVRELARLHLDEAKKAGLWIDVERSVYQRGPQGEYLLIGEPDNVVGPVWEDEGAVDDLAERSRSSGAVAVAEPKAVHEIVLDGGDAERYRQDYLVVREMGLESRVVAVVELLSYANKAGGYAPRYLEKRLRFVESQAHFMEIDFLRFGENESRAAFPELPRTAYFIFVARKTGVGRLEEGYPLELRDPLPTIGLPAGPRRADLPLNLGAAFGAAYELAVRPGSIDYATVEIPPPALSPDERAWVNECRGARG